MSQNFCRNIDICQFLRRNEKFSDNIQNRYVFHLQSDARNIKGVTVSKAGASVLTSCVSTLSLQRQSLTVVDESIFFELHISGEQNG